jgi:simple sugar transport system permease protein
MTEPTATAASPDKRPAAAEVGPGTSGSGGTSFRVEFLRQLWSANTVVVTLLAIVLAMVVGGILMIVSDKAVLNTYAYFFARPGDALSSSWTLVSEGYANMFKGAVVDPATVQGLFDGRNGWESVLYPISETLTFAAPLIFTGLSFALAMRGGLFSIGAQGQAIMGAIAAGLVGFLIPLPPVLHMIVALLAAAVGGGLFGYIPGFLKARTGAHEVITTIMLNYVALYFIAWLIIQRGVQDPTRPDAISKPVAGLARLPGMLHFVGPSLRVNFGIVLGVAAAWGVAWMLDRSTSGFELRAVGSNPDAARTAGIKVASTYVFVMAVTGALAGLGGSAVLLGTEYRLSTQVVGSVGFDGILVALLGRARPWGVVLGALLFGALRAGGNRMQSYSSISIELVTVIQALIVIFVAAPALVKAVFRLRAARVARLETGTSKGW